MHSAIIQFHFIFISFLLQPPAASRFTDNSDEVVLTLEGGAATVFQLDSIENYLHQISSPGSETRDSGPRTRDPGRLDLRDLNLVDSKVCPHWQSAR